jgi:hypothetical protein
MVMLIIMSIQESPMAATRRTQFLMDPEEFRNFGCWHGERRPPSETVLRGASGANIAFKDLRRLLLRLGFGERIRRSHHIFWKDGIEEILNLRPKGNKAKPYQQGFPPGNGC